MSAAAELRLALVTALLASAAAVPRHEEAPVVGVNGTFNTHFSARIDGLASGACVIFEAQVGTSKIQHYLRTSLHPARAH